MYENRFNDFRLPSGMLIVFLEKALTLIHMETHLDDVSAVLSLSIIVQCRIYPNVINSIIGIESWQLICSFLLIQLIS
jgi:hypothetical protein